jgi:poly-gamma-glutamate capsule biosynthesis protein CapA/YwtB (metallophosphatase superfamily)
MISPRVRRRRRQVAVGALVVIAGIVLAVVETGGPATTPAARHAGASTTTSVRQRGRPATHRPATSSPLTPTWTGDGRAVTLAFGGDVHFEGVLGTRLADDPATALDGNVASLLSGSDLSMVNFESALTDGTCPDPQPKQYVFYAPSSAITAFQSAKVTLVTEANNHGEDCGLAGLEMSMAIAKQAGYPIIGIGADAAQAFAPYRATINGQRIAIIAATQVIDTDLQTAWTATATQPGLASAYSVDTLVDAVEAARKTADTVVVYLHWGTETQTCPNPLQEPLANALVKAGADIVVGTHAHVQLGAGFLGTAFVDYGLGNLAFYDTTPPETYSGSLLVTVTGRHIDGTQWRPALIEAGIPVPLSGDEATEADTRWAGLRSCTDLSAGPAPSLATPVTEAELPPASVVATLSDLLPDARTGSPGTTRRAARVTKDS